MKKRCLAILLIAGVLSALVLTGCLYGDSESGEHGGGSGSRENSGASESGEHGGGAEANEHGEDSESGEGDEESGTQFGLSETFDEVRAGARLVLSYDSTAESFVGTVSNTTESALSRVRVEVHLSNGTELGPTTPTDLDPGQAIDVVLPATGRSFNSWSAHPEVG